MAANVNLTDAARRMCDALVDLIDAGAGAGTIKIYDDTAAQPAGPATAISTQVLLATLTFSATAFGAAAAGVATASAITDDSSADATGTANFARWADSNALDIIDCSVGTVAAGTEDIQFNSINFTILDAVSITSLTVTQPA